MGKIGADKLFHRWGPFESYINTGPLQFVSRLLLDVLLIVFINHWAFKSATIGESD